MISSMMISSLKITMSSLFFYHDSASDLVLFVRLSMVLIHCLSTGLRNLEIYAKQFQVVGLWRAQVRGQQGGGGASYAPSD